MPLQEKVGVGVGGGVGVQEEFEGDKDALWENSEIVEPLLITKSCSMRTFSLCVMGPAQLPVSVAISLIAW